MSSEKIMSQGEATESAIQAFIRGDEEEWTDAARFAPEGRGLGSGPDSESQRIAAHDVPTNPPAAAQERVLPSDAHPANYQQLYGEEANEKGRWRRTAEEALAELQQAKQELLTLRSMPGAGYQPQPTYQPPPSYQPPYSPYSGAYSVPSYQPQYPPQQPATQEAASLFPNKNEGDYVEVQELNAVVQRMIAPAVMQLWQQQQQMAVAQVASKKVAAGITPQVEARLNASFPWLGSIADGPPRIAAMQDILNRETNQPTAPVRAQQATQSPVEAAARRVTYIESAGQRSSRGPGEGPTVQQVMAEEFARATTAADKKAVLMKYGVQQVNDYGPNVYTR